MRQVGKHHCTGFLCVLKFSAYLVKYQGRWLLGHTVRICLVQEPAKLSSGYIPTTVRVSSCCPTSLSTFGLVTVLDFCHSHRCVVVSYRLDLHFLVTLAIEHIICHLNVFFGSQFLFSSIFFFIPSQQPYPTFLQPIWIIHVNKCGVHPSGPLCFIILTCSNKNKYLLSICAQCIRLFITSALVWLLSFPVRKLLNSIILKPPFST